MKNKTSIEILTVGIIAIVALVYAEVWYWNSLPQMVEYSFPIPQIENSTAFKFVETPNIGIVGEVTYGGIHAFPYIYTGTGRVNETSSIIVAYYGGNTTGLLNGTNIEEIAELELIQTETYRYVITEEGNHKLPTYDPQFYVILIAITIGVGFSVAFFAWIEMDVMNEELGE